MMNKFWILALSLMVGGALTACGQGMTGGQTPDPAETAAEAVSVSMDASTEEAFMEESSAEGTSAADPAVEGTSADGISVEETSADTAVTDGIKADSSAAAYAAGTETAAAEVYTSREEAYRAFLETLDPDEWEGAALMDLGRKQEPSLFIAGKRGNNGSLLVFYDRGSLHDYTLGKHYPTWLEAERLLCDSALEGRRHYDRIYSIGEASLTEVAEGNYGMAEDGTGWTYIWAGAQMNREGYRQAMDFLYDRSRAISFQDQDLRPLAEWIGLWTEEAPDGDTSAAAAMQGDTSAAAETGGTAAAEN